MTDTYAATAQWALRMKRREEEDSRFLHANSLNCPEDPGPGRAARWGASVRLMGALAGFAAASVAAVSVACGAGSNPTSPQKAPATVTALRPLSDPIPFEALGSGRIAFHRIGNGRVGESGVYVIDVAARRSWGFAEGSGGLYDGPALSPSGDRVAFSDLNPGPAGTYDIYTADLFGQDRRLVAGLPEDQEDSPSWTPDGRVAFTSYPNILYFDAQRMGPLPQMVVPWGRVSVAPHGLVAYSYGPILVAEPGGASAVEAVVAGQDLSLWAPTWSPDGDEIAYLSTPRGVLPAAGFTMEVVVLDFRRRRSEVWARLRGYGGSSWHGSNELSLAWAPEGDRVLVTFPDASAPPGSVVAVDYHVWMVGRDGSAIRVTSAPGVSDYSVSWSR